MGKAFYGLDHVANFFTKYTFQILFIHIIVSFIRHFDQCIQLFHPHSAFSRNMPTNVEIQLTQALIKFAQRQGSYKIYPDLIWWGKLLTKTLR